VHDAQLPAGEHTWLVPHDVPPGAAAPVSTQVDRPPAHDVVPRWHAPAAGVQAAPSLHATHAPALQNFPDAHASPSGALLPLSTQTLTPVVHEVLPTWHALADGTHATFALHAWHAPALQTRSTPQLLPSLTFAPASLQTGAPDEQSVFPWWQGFAAYAHGASC
jgi:hypothetical protein